jgi:tripartite-type tricarboxylate transporter receptor subunit TctC
MPAVVSGTAGGAITKLPRDIVINDRNFQLAVLCALATVMPDTTLAQEWPHRPVRIVVPFVAGGISDNLARITAEWLTPRLGHTVQVENRAGASGSIAAELVARSAPDGYTLLMATATQLAAYPAIASVNYDVRRDFAPISVVGTNAFALGVHPSVPAHTVRELVALARWQPGALNYGSAGTGSNSHLTMAQFLIRVNVQMNHVPYRGGAAAVADLLGGHIAAHFGNMSDMLPHDRTGRLRTLAVSSTARVPQLPSVPTVAEQGYPGFVSYAWNGLVAPRATPTVVIARVAAEVAAAARDPRVIQRLDLLGIRPWGSTPQEFAKIIDQSIVQYTEIVRVTGIRAEVDRP